MGNFRRIKRILATALSVAMIGTIMPSSVFAASKALTAVKYYSKGALRSCTDYTVVDSSTTELTTGWYVVNTPVTMEERVEVHGDVRIIVASGGAYRLKEGIHVAYGNKLAIFGYGQEEGSFLAYCNGEHEWPEVPDCAAIGGDKNEINGNIEIFSGLIVVEAGSGGAGIGTGAFESREAFEAELERVNNSEPPYFEPTPGPESPFTSHAGPILIENGKVYAVGGMDAAGIGGGKYADGPETGIRGGNVTGIGYGGGAGIGGGLGGCTDGIGAVESTVTGISRGSGAGLGNGDQANYWTTKKHIIVARDAQVIGISEEHGRPFLCSASDDISKVVEDMIHTDSGLSVCAGNYVSEDDFSGMVMLDDVMDTIHYEVGKIYICQHQNHTYECTETGHSLKCTDCHVVLEEEPHVFGDDGVCTVCGYSFPSIIISATVIFTGKVEVRYKMFFSEAMRNDPDAYVTFTRNGKTTRTLISSANPNGSGLVNICNPVEAPEFGDPTVINVYNGAGEKQSLMARDGYDWISLTETGFSYSVMDYATRIRESTYDPEMKTLAEALYMYGSSASANFKPNGEAWEDLEGFTKPTVTEADLAAYEITTTGTRPAGIDKVTIRAYFESDNILRITYYFKEGTDVNDYIFGLDSDEDLTPIMVSENVYAIDVDSIAAAELDDDHFFRIALRGSNAEPYVIKASALSYALTSMRNGNEKRKELGKSFYLYNVAANAYFDS